MAPVLLLALAACRSSPDPGALGRRPADFALSVNVYGPAGAPERALRPGRYLVEADGLLRAVARNGDGSFPPPARQLPPSAFDELWAMVRQSGILEPGSRYRVPTLVQESAESRAPAAAFHA